MEWTEAKNRLEYGQPDHTTIDKFMMITAIGWACYKGFG